MPTHEIPGSQPEGELPGSSYSANAYLSALLNRFGGEGAALNSSQISPEQDSSRNFLNNRLNRRAFNRRALGASLGIFLGSRVLGGDFLRSAEAAKEINYALPVDSKKRDERLKGIGHTSIKSVGALDDESKAVSIASIELNPNLSKIVRTNRADLAGLNNGLRNHYLSTEYLQGGKDPAKIIALLASGTVPPEPDWGKYFEMVKNGDDLTYDVMALPHGAEAIPENVQWMKADPRLGTAFVLTDKKGLYEIQSWTDDQGNILQAAGVTMRANDEGKMIYEGYLDPNLLKDSIVSNPNIDPQIHMNMAISALVKTAFIMGQMTLGIVHDLQGHQENLWNGYFVANYTIDDLLVQMYQDQGKILLGEKPDFSETLAHVNFSLPSNT
jgi:hypothetical protein